MAGDGGKGRGERGREDSLEDGVVIGKKEGVGSRVLGVLNWTKGILIVRGTRYYNTLSERGGRATREDSSAASGLGSQTSPGRLTPNHSHNPRVPVQAQRARATIRAATGNYRQLFSTLPLLSRLARAVLNQHLFLFSTCDPICSPAVPLPLSQVPSPTVLVPSTR